jgi:hypothetical protein
MTTWLVLAVLLASGERDVHEAELWVELVDTVSLGDTVLQDIRSVSTVPPGSPWSGSGRAWPSPPRTRRPCISWMRYRLA